MNSEHPTCRPVRRKHLAPMRFECGGGWGVGGMRAMDTGQGLPHFLATAVRMRSSPEGTLIAVSDNHNDRVSFLKIICTVHSNIPTNINT
jgi:hypothetical protein